MIVYRVWFTDGGRVDYQVVDLSDSEAWHWVVEKATAATYNGRLRDVRQITKIVED